MDKQEMPLEQLEQLAALMAQSMQTIDCPDCCDCGPVYQYMELSARLYQDEWEWSMLAHTLVYTCQSRKQAPGKDSGA